MLTFLTLNYIITWKTAWDLEDCAFASVGCWVRLLFPNSSIPSSSSAEVGLKRQGTFSIYWIFKHRGEDYIYLTCSCNQFALNQSICAHFVQIKRIEGWGHEKLAPNTFQNLKAVLWKNWPVHKGSNHPKSLKEKVESLLHLACQDIKCVSLFW